MPEAGQGRRPLVHRGMVALHHLREALHLRADGPGPGERTELDIDGIGGNRHMGDLGVGQVRGGSLGCGEGREEEDQQDRQGRAVQHRPLQR